ncbi:MAG: hypothetical protein QXZ11_07775 [Thermoproteota archaeon]
MAEENVVIPPYKPPYDAEYIRRILTEYVDDLLYRSCCRFYVECVNETKELFEFDVVLDPLAGRLAGVYMRKLCNFFDKHFPRNRVCLYPA